MCTSTSEPAFRRPCIEFFDHNAELEARHEYTVAWIDCLADKPRGIFMAGDHAETPGFIGAPARGDGGPAVPFKPPISLINSLSLHAFNFAYYHRPVPAQVARGHVPLHQFATGAPSGWNPPAGICGFFSIQFIARKPERRAHFQYLRHHRRERTGLLSWQCSRPSASCRARECCPSPKPG